MSRFATFLATACALLTAGAIAHPAHAAVRFATDRMTVREDAGAALVTVVRSAVDRGGQVRYGVWPGTAREGLDYRRVSGRIDFAPGQREATIAIPIVDDARVEGPETLRVGIYGGHPERVGSPNRLTLTIVDDDAIGTERDPRNPLGLSPPPPGPNPLHGASFYANPRHTIAGTVIRRIRRRQPRAARLLRVIAEQPETKRFGSFTRQPRLAVSRFLERAEHERPGSVPLLATYRLQHKRCGGVSDSPAEARRVKRWYRAFAEGIGNHRAVVFIEIDGLITVRCLSPRGLRVRIAELRAAIGEIARLPHVVAYVDAGSGLAHTPAYIARLLRRVGVHRIQGFFTNSTHQNWTSREASYGRELVRRLGGRPRQVINTATNGRGPLVPRDRARYGNSFRCNAPGRGLGPKPTWNVPARFGHVDAFVWIGNPGRSAGRCAARHHRYVPPTGSFWVDYAVELVRNADFRVR